jgi:signal transduction histidine kinase
LCRQRVGDIVLAMFGQKGSCELPRSRLGLRCWNGVARQTGCCGRVLMLLGCVFAMLVGVASSSAEILWSDPASRVIHATGAGVDILGGAVKRDDTASDALYFKFHVDPLSDAASEPYFAVFQLFEGDHPRLAVGNAPEAWGYSACFTSEIGPSNKLSGEFNLNSSKPEAAGLGVFKPYELPSHNHERTIIFKVQFIPGGDDLITVWLDPNLAAGATVENQPEILTTRFKANASFEQIRLRHEGGGNGWIFSDMAIATSFHNFVVVRFWQTWWFAGWTALVLLAGVATSVRIVERRKYQRWLHIVEQDRALQRERARIAQDLHDELGSSLARISLLSSLARADLQNPRELEMHVVEIAQSADATVRALEEIVWAVRPGSDTLQSLVEYVAHFAKELFEGDTTRCRLDLPADLPARQLPPEMRHNIFLVVKEALTNAFKHAGAQEVIVQAQASPALLTIEVKDDGRGFDSQEPARPGKRQGLGNMQSRAAAMGGTVSVESASGKGTTVRLSVRFPAVAADRKA